MNRIDSARITWKAILSPFAVALTIYLIFLSGVLARYAFSASALIQLGSQEPTQAARDLPSGLVVYESPGYDGQYYYLVALDLIRHTRSGVHPAWYQRVVYPAVAALLSFGQQQWLPVSLIAANIAGLIVGTVAFSLLLLKYRVSVWFSLLFAVNPGQILSLQLDLPFPLEMGLATMSLWLWDRRRVVMAAFALAASILTSESAVLFLFPLLAAELSTCRWRTALILACSVIPYLLWQGVLTLMSGQSGVTTSASLVALPFQGMMQALGLFVTIPVEGPADWVRRGAVVLVMALMLAAALVSTWRLREGYDAFTGGVFSHAAFSFFAAFPIWEAFSSAGRVFSGIFPFLVLSFVFRQERATALLLAASAGLTLFTLVRPFLVTPMVPYYVTP